MEILDTYDFETEAQKLSKEIRAERREWLIALCDGKIRRFHKSELPRYSGSRLRTIGTIIKNEILHIYADLDMKINMRLEEETDHIVIQVLIPDDDDE